MLLTRLVYVLGIIMSTAVAETIIYSGFSPQCQSCLDNAVGQCSSTGSFDNCVCQTDGDGFVEVFSHCTTSFCTSDRGQVLLNQWADYCCPLVTNDAECVEYLATRTHSLPTMTLTTESKSATNFPISTTSTNEPNPTGSAAERSLVLPSAWNTAFVLAVVLEVLRSM